MPCEGMTANLHLILLGILNHTVGIPAEAVTSGLGCIELHGVLKNHHVEVLGDGLAKVVVVAYARVHAGTEVLANLVGPVSYGSLLQ